MALKNKDREKMRVVRLHPSTHHTWPQLSVCLSCVFSASPLPPSEAQLGSVITREGKKLTPLNMAFNLLIGVCMKCNSVNPIGQLLSLRE
jgi:hypothetical protein